MAEKFVAYLGLGLVWGQWVQLSNFEKENSWREMMHWSCFKP